MKLIVEEQARNKHLHESLDGVRNQARLVVKAISAVL